MSIGYTNSLDYIKDRIHGLASETQEKYYIEKLDLLINYVKEKLETYNDSRVLIEIYDALVGEFKCILENITKAGNKELLFNISLDIEDEIEKLNCKHVS